MKLKTVDERGQGKHLRRHGCTCPERLVAALDPCLLQSARVGATRGQGKHKEDDGQHVELVHFCAESGAGNVKKRWTLEGALRWLRGVQVG